MVDRDGYLVENSAREGVDDVEEVIINLKPLRLSFYLQFNRNSRHDHRYRQ